MSDFLSWVIQNLTSVIGVVFASIFELLHMIFDYLYGYIVAFFTDSYFSDVGYNFFNTIYTKTRSISFSFNMVYWVVGLTLCMYVVKRVVFPLISSVIDNIHDLFTPS